MDEFALLDATAQADLVRRGEVTPLELVEAAIARIQRVNPALNAVVTPLFDGGREAARRALPEGPFAGVPFLLKDLGAPLAGAPMTAGSAFLRDYVPGEDSEFVRRLKACGLIILGKTNTPEFGLRPTTEPRLFGATRNPWDLQRTPGGSSGGSAAAVAAGLVPMAHANDGGGSIRIPASCCGLFGLKPTRGRNPQGPGYGDVGFSLGVTHVVTRSVRDSAALLDWTAGPRPGDLGDPFWAPAPRRPFREELGADPGRLRIAFTCRTPGGRETHPDCASAARETAALCAALGHDVEDAAPTIPFDAVLEAFRTLWSVRCAQTLDRVAQGRALGPELFEPLTWALYEMGRAQSAIAYTSALEQAQSLELELARFLARYDLWLTPTLAEPPPPLGTFDVPGDPWAGYDRAVEFTPFTPPANVSGQPAMSVPLFWNAEGLPIGSHFLARYGDESTLFRLAAQLEAARPWAGRHPPSAA